MYQGLSSNLPEQHKVLVKTPILQPLGTIEKKQKNLVLFIAITLNPPFQETCSRRIRVSNRHCYCKDPSQAKKIATKYIKNQLPESWENYQFEEYIALGKESVIEYTPYDLNENETEKISEILTSCIGKVYIEFLTTEITSTKDTVQSMKNELTKSQIDNLDSRLEAMQSILITLSEDNNNDYDHIMSNDDRGDF